MTRLLKRMHQADQSESLGSIKLSAGSPRVERKKIVQIIRIGWNLIFQSIIPTLPYQRQSQRQRLRLRMGHIFWLYSLILFQLKCFHLSLYPLTGYYKFLSSSNPNNGSWNETGSTDTNKDNFLHPIRTRAERKLLIGTNLKLMVACSVVGKAIISQFAGFFFTSNFP